MRGAPLIIEWQQFSINYVSKADTHVYTAKSSTREQLNGLTRGTLQEPVIIWFCTMLGKTHKSQLFSLDAALCYLMLPRSSCTMLCKRLLSKASLV